MSGKAPRRKGFGFEREVVNAAKEAGLCAKRAYGSNGEAMGMHAEVDMVIGDAARPARSRRLGRARVPLAPLEDRSRPREARDRGPLAPPRLPPLLAMDLPSGTAAFTIDIPGAKQHDPLARRARSAPQR